MTGNRKIGLYGGTFNPVHNGHLKVITHVKKVFGLDVVHLIPSARPPHKSTAHLAPAEDRLKMVQDAVAHLSGVSASDIELKRLGHSYTIDTLRQFVPPPEHNPLSASKSPPEGSRKSVFFILGTDAFFDMTTWKQTKDIFRISHLIIMTRAGDPRKVLDILHFLKQTVSSHYIEQFPPDDFHGNSPCEDGHRDYLSDDIRTLIHRDTDPPEFKAVHICNVPKIPISSTEIRKRIHAGLSIKELVPDCVERLIRQKGLYFDN